MEQLGQRLMPAAADFSPALRARLLVLQGTPFCNLDCSYCYLPGRDRRERMDIATVHAAARRLREDGLAGDELTVVWHAGEPLVLPPSFYEEAFAALADALGPGTLLTHSIQTNEVLLDEAWCRLLRRHAVALGVSVDGPAHLHDRHRRTRDGRPTHAAVLRAMQLLQAQGVPFHAIAVVGADTLAEPDAFYDFFDAAGVREVGCNVDEAEGANARSSLQGREAAHADFMDRLLERSLEGGGRVVFRELAQAWQRLAQPMPRYAVHGDSWPDNAQVLPFALVTVAANGDFGTFSPEFIGQRVPAWGDFVLGNVHRSGYLASMDTPAFQRLWGQVHAGVRECRRRCPQFDWCGGGSPVNKFYETGSMATAETLYCRTMIQHPFDSVLRRAERETQP